MRPTLAILAAAALCTAAQTSRADSVRDYLFRAIDAGEASGPVDDATARAWKQQTGSDGPVFATVRTIASFQQKGCKRLELVLSQDGVPTRDGPKTRIGLPMQLNLCRDGSPPVEGMDTEKIRDAISKSRQK